MTDQGPDYAAMTDEEILERALRLQHTFPKECLLAHLVGRFARFVTRAGASAENVLEFPKK